MRLSSLILIGVALVIVLTLTLGLPDVALAKTRPWAI